MSEKNQKTSSIDEVKRALVQMQSELSYVDRKSYTSLVGVSCIFRENVKILFLFKSKGKKTLYFNRFCSRLKVNDFTTDVKSNGNAPKYVDTLITDRSLLNGIIHATNKPSEKKLFSLLAEMLKAYEDAVIDINKTYNIKNDVKHVNVHQINPKKTTSAKPKKQTTSTKTEVNTTSKPKQNSKQKKEAKGKLGNIKYLPFPMEGNIKVKYIGGYMPSKLKDYNQIKTIDGVYSELQHHYSKCNQNVYIYTNGSKTVSNLIIYYILFPRTKKYVKIDNDTVKLVYQYGQSLRSTDLYFNHVGRFRMLIKDVDKLTTARPEMNKRHIMSAFLISEKMIMN